MVVCYQGLQSLIKHVERLRSFRQRSEEIEIRKEIRICSI